MGRSFSVGGHLVSDYVNGRRRRAIEQYLNWEHQRFEYGLVNS